MKGLTVSAIPICSILCNKILSMLFFESKKIAEMKEKIVYTLQERMKMTLIYGTENGRWMGMFIILAFNIAKTNLQIFKVLVYLES